MSVLVKLTGPGAEAAREEIGQALEDLRDSGDADTFAWEDLTDEVQEAWQVIYEHAIPDPEEHDDDHVPLAERQRFEEALASVHAFLGKGGAE